MKQFIIGNNATDFTELECQARSACVVFRDQELPPACVPARGRIGFEIDSTTGRARLYVERGIRYCGSNPIMRSWFERGEISFGDFTTLKRWITSDLKAEFERSLDVASPATTSIPIDRAASNEPVARSPMSLYLDNSFRQAGELPCRPSLLSGLILFAIRQFGQNFGLDVIAVDEALLGAIASKLDLMGEQPLQFLFDDLLAGPFAVVAAQGGSTITVHGPPVSCKAASKNRE